MSKISWFPTAVASAFLAASSVSAADEPGEQIERTLTVTKAMLSEPTAPRYLAVGTHNRAILTRGSHSGDRGQKARALFADFFFVEAMLCYRELKN